MSSLQNRRPIVVKIGGSTLGSEDTSLEDLALLQRCGKTCVVIHGGGKVITSWLQRSGADARFVRGLRVTDGPTLEVVVSVLAGLVNKQLVASLQAYGAKAVGLSGVDGAMLQGEVLDPELGFVGRVTQVNPEPVLDLLQAGYLPVIAPVAVHCTEKDAGTWTLLNVNADTAAGELAAALEAEQLLFLTDTEGVLDASRSPVPRLSLQQAQDLIVSGVIAGGMIPKVEACLRALPYVGRAQIVDGRVPHALSSCLQGQAVGTRVG